MTRYGSIFLALLLSLLLIVAPVSPALAQDLGQVFEWTEIGLTMNYPNGWVEAQINEGTRALLSDPAIDINSDETPNSPVVVMLAFPMEEVGAMGSPRDMLTLFAGEFGDETSMVEDLTVGGLPALRVTAIPEQGFTATIILITSDTYAYILGGISPTGANFGPLFDSMIATVAIAGTPPVASPVTGVPTVAAPAAGAADVTLVSVIITLDQSLTGTWNEIDAVELIGLDAGGNTVRQWAVTGTATSQYGEGAWSAQQMAGAPDTLECGDSGTAWASSSSTGQDTVTLFYNTPVIPTEINIHESYNPGAIVKVELFVNYSFVTVFEGVDPTTACPGVFSIPVGVTPTTPPVSSTGETLFGIVSIHLDQTITNRWNEIDAVELVGTDATGNEIRQWANFATATSEYSPDSWSAQQATGAPNTTDCGDRTTAWASATVTGQDALVLTYSVPVVPTEINIYQTYNPGAIVRVLVVPDDISQGEGFPVFEGRDSTTACPGILTIPVDMSATEPVTFGLDYGSTVTGSLNNTTFSQDWPFQGSAGDVVTITMLNTGGDLDPYLYLLDAAGNELANNDDAADMAVGSYNSQIAGFTLPATGTYTIRASRFGDQYGSSTGSYSLALEAAGGSTPPSAPPSAVGNTLSYGQTANGLITDASPSQVFVFSGNAGDVVTITMQGTPPLDAYLLLKNASGQEVAYNDDAGDPTLGVSDARILNFPLPAAGQYTIEATRFSGTGAYTLTLESGAAAPVASVAQPITYGSTVTGTISDQAFRAEWTFTAVRGDVVTITMVAAAGSSLDPYLSLLGPDGAEVAYNDDATDTTVGGYNAQIAKYVVQTDGTYTIVATRFGENLGSGSGNYDLSIRLGK